MIVVDLTDREAQEKIGLDICGRSYHDVVVRHEDIELPLKFRVDKDRRSIELVPHIPTVEERYAIVSKYMNNQSDEGWHRLLATLKGLNP